MHQVVLYSKGLEFDVFLKPLAEKVIVGESAGETSGEEPVPHPRKKTEHDFGVPRTVNEQPFQGS